MIECVITTTGDMSKGMLSISLLYKCFKEELGLTTRFVVVYKHILANLPVKTFKLEKKKRVTELWYHEPN